MRDLLEYRSEFPILEDTTYLVSHLRGPMPRGAEERLGEYARMAGAWDPRVAGGPTPWTVGDQIGRIIGMFRPSYDCPIGSTRHRLGNSFAHASNVSTISA